uniref:BTB domain-containing protein n=1 Tax=Anopheles christyi TaxID=43041 RepID=A0A182JYG4_9DIPT
MSLPINSLYSLTWGDYGTSLVSAVQLLRCHGDLVDVTLAAGGRSFPAHKIVLCAASPFLLELLKVGVPFHFTSLRRVRGRERDCNNI